MTPETYRNYKWYYYLVPQERKGISLLENQNMEYNGDRLLVCQETKSRKYAIFGDYIDLFNYNKLTPAPKRCFYEIVYQNMAQKPYFDVDISREKWNNMTELEADEVIYMLIRVIYRLIPGLERTGKVLVSTCHRESKFSYHVIVDDWCFANSKENAYFFTKVMEEMPEEMRNFFDHGMYKTIQQFRLCGSRKFGTTDVLGISLDLCAPQNFIPKNMITNEQIDLYLFGSNLITRTKSCNYIIGFTPPVTKRIYSGEAISYDDGDIDRVMEMAASLLEDAFEVVDIVDHTGSIVIILKRLQATWCEVCQRTHENENPFILISGKERNVQFNCRRSNGKMIYIGTLGKSQEDMNDEADDEGEEQISAIKKLRNMLMPKDEPNESIEIKLVYKFDIEEDEGKDITLTTEEYKGPKIKKLSKKKIIYEEEKDIDLSKGYEALI